MALTHVLMWDDEYGYRPVTVCEAALEHRETVSASRGIFICDICHQNVMFTMGRVRPRHFRHDSTALTKDCEQRSVQYECTQKYWTFQRYLHTLPLRLKQMAGQYRLELGFLALSEESLGLCRGKTLCINGQNSKGILYDIAERLQPECLTWLDVGTVPAESYSLSLEDGGALPPRWPHQVDGVNEMSLFDAASGKKLPPAPDVVVGKEYIVACRTNIHQCYAYDVSIVLISRKEHGWDGWNLYRVTARRFSKIAAHFFLRFRATLTKCPPRIFPLWPAFVRTPHLTYHNAQELFIFIEGDNAQVQLFPERHTYMQGNERARVFCFAAGSKKQMVTGVDDEYLLQVGRTHMLRYDYFIRKELNQTAFLPEVTVTDPQGTVLNENQIETQPSGIIVQVFAPFDGEAWLEKDGFLLTRIELKGGEKRELKVNRGQTLTIFQGLDRIRSIHFYRPKGKNFGDVCNKESLDDALLCRRLQRMTGDEVPAAHILGMAVQSFREYRATCAWLLMRKAEGRISARALSLIRTLMSE